MNPEQFNSIAKEAFFLLNTFIVVEKIEERKLKKHSFLKLGQPKMIYLAEDVNFGKCFVFKDEKDRPNGTSHGDPLTEIYLKDPEKNLYIVKSKNATYEIQQVTTSTQ